MSTRRTATTALISLLALQLACSENATTSSRPASEGAVLGTGSLDCPVVCQRATACLGDHPDCARLSDVDASRALDGCLQICDAEPAVLAAFADGIETEPTTCDGALEALLGNADLAQGSGREAIERCGPSGPCQSGCDTLGYCAESLCSNGADGGTICAACTVLCRSDESWVEAVTGAEASGGCRAALGAYPVADVLPSGCPALD